MSIPRPSFEYFMGAILVGLFYTMIVLAKDIPPMTLLCLGGMMLILLAFTGVGFFVFFVLMHKMGLMSWMDLPRGQEEAPPAPKTS